MDQMTQFSSAWRSGPPHFAESLATGYLSTAGQNGKRG